MIDIPTVFILGAGSSKPYGYPTGAELRKSIIKEFYVLLKGLLKDLSIQEIEKQHHLREAKRFVDAFNNSSIISIDKFLSLNPIFSYYGKLAITLIISKNEKSSKFREDVEDDQDWYKLLFNRMISTFNEPSDFDKFCKNKVAFITFNYDRSLEYFIFESFYNAFWNNRKKIESAFMSLEGIKTYIPFPFIHVYGQIDKIKAHGGWDYREKLAFSDIKKLSENIRVIGERANNIEEIKEIITESKRIFFLGFGYAKENIDSIGILDIINEKWQIYGTAKSMTEKEIKEVKSTFRKNFPKSYPSVYGTQIETKDCYELLKEYL